MSSSSHPETRAGSVVSATATSSRHSDPTPPPPLFSAGAVVGGRYRVVRYLARGGMGEVYEVVDLELATTVALKTIRGERVGDGRSNDRLKREVLAARRISHANVCRLFDFGVHLLDEEHEAAFITMELLLGETLDALVRRRGRLDTAELRLLAPQLAEGLAAAHAAGVVHRDFKSHNVILLGKGVETRAVIADFGLARTLDGDITETIEFAGSPAYMAPEQVARSGRITAAADIYALGVVLYEMVTGDVPFRGDGPMATAAMRLTTDPEPPSRHTPVDPALEAFVMRCLQRDPARRPASPLEVIQAVAADARAPAPQRRALRAGFAVAGVAVLGLVGALLLMSTGESKRGLRAAMTPACLPPEGPDLHVDAAAAPGGTGSAACPLRTITAALAAPGATKRIRVAAGTYDRALGEEFPLVLRGEVSLVGAGRDRTFVRGAGDVDNREVGGVLSEPGARAALVVGDRSAHVELANFTVASDEPDQVFRGAAVLCDRGSATTFEDELAPPNTTLRGLGLGPGFDEGAIAVTQSKPTPTGCNLVIEDSEVRGNSRGLWIAGCGGGEGMSPVAVRVARTLFIALGSRGDIGDNGVGISVWDCTRELVVTGSRFVNSGIGISVVRHNGAPPGRVTIESSTFFHLRKAGVWISRAANVVLKDNTIHENSGGDDERAAGVVLDGLPGDDFPRVSFRGNVIVQNDIGVDIRGTGAILPGVVDLGRPDDPGQNTFACNSTGLDDAEAGADLLVRLPAVPGASMQAAGNRWNHAPVRVRRGARAANGTDVLITATPAVTIDTRGARGGGDCAGGLPGPP